MVTSALAVLERGRRAVRGALRPGRHAALGAGVGCAAYGALKLYWALGGELLLREAPLSAEQRRDVLERTGAIATENWPRSRWRGSASSLTDRPNGRTTLAEWVLPKPTRTRFSNSRA
jgi:hypothetical protein